MRKIVVYFLIVTILGTPAAAVAGVAGVGGSVGAAGTKAAHTVSITLEGNGGNPCPTETFNEKGLCIAVNRLINEMLAISYTFSSLEVVPNPNNIESSAALLVKLVSFR